MPDLVLFAAALPDMGFVIASVAFTVVAVSIFAYAGGPYYWTAIEFLEQDFFRRLRSARVPQQRIRRALIAWSVVQVGVFLTIWIGLGFFVLGLFAMLMMLCVPWYMVRRTSLRYRERIEDQLADAMVGLSNAVKAGLSLAQALELLADQSPKPIDGEFRRIVGEYQMGKPLDRTLQEAKERLDSEHFALFAAALMASRESGGKLNETVDRIARSVRELRRLERKIRSETAMARKSAVYMAFAPFLVLGMYYFVDPKSVHVLFTEFLGNVLLMAAVLCNVGAYFWAQKILNPNI